ncbi:MAG: cache domain-containing protein [Lunatimonas sp.]|uniref:cache domain-containing protein n=1 Tax=Lunatimonas sp. TaxID=2060141 RepID=UPI00263B8BEF|nr:cache domain-containing protein [Lunatimonas sp.]MCC5935646.1 cache domain-containing protein [Lunatimonas sp.]
MKYFYFVSFGVLLISSSCKSEESRVSHVHFDFLDSVIQALETDLIPLEDEIAELARFTEGLYLLRDSLVQVANKSKYFIDRNDWFRNQNWETSESTVFVSYLAEDHDRSVEEVYLTEPLDRVFPVLTEKYPMVAQVYYNTKSQTSRVYPPYDLMNTIEPEIDVTAFNFFYLGTEARNPDRGHVWIDEIYIDPAGRGWILSLIHPVYHGDECKGVLGFDITLTDLMPYFSDNNNGNLMIIDGQGTIVAGGKQAIEALSMPPLRNHTYIQTILADNFRKEDFNLFKSKSKEVRQMAAKFLMEKEAAYRFDLDGDKLEAFCSPMNLFGWYMLSIQSME